jgi:hypothetical protein
MPEKSKARMVDREKERPKPDKLPDFRYRAGTGPTITGNKRGEKQNARDNLLVGLSLCMHIRLFPRLLAG